MKKFVEKLKRRLKMKNNENELSHVPEELRKLIHSSTERYLNILGMNNYKPRIMFEKKGCNTNNDPSADIVAATATVDNRYLTITIRIFSYVIEQWRVGDMNDDDIRDIISHEVSHVATNALYDKAISSYKTEEELKDAWESLTTTIGRLIYEIDKNRSIKK